MIKFYLFSFWIFYKFKVKESNLATLLSPLLLHSKLELGWQVPTKIRNKKMMFELIKVFFFLHIGKSSAKFLIEMTLHVICN